MTAELIDLNQVRQQRETDKRESLTAEDFPICFSPEQCSQAREMLAWSVEALAFRSGASIQSIKEYESGTRQLRAVTIQALSFAFEAQALIFFPGHEPMIADNLRGATPDPKTRHDFHLIE